MRALFEILDLKGVCYADDVGQSTPSHHPRKEHLFQSRQRHPLLYGSQTSCHGTHYDSTHQSVIFLDIMWVLQGVQIYNISTAVFHKKRSAFAYIRTINFCRILTMRSAGYFGGGISNRGSNSSLEQRHKYS